MIKKKKKKKDNLISMTKCRLHIFLARFLLHAETSAALPSFSQSTHICASQRASRARHRNLKYRHRVIRAYRGSFHALYVRACHETRLMHL